MTTDIATLGIKVDTTQAARGASDLERFEESAGKAGRAVDKMENEVNSILGPLRALQGLLAGVTAALGIQKLIEYADTWNLLNARIKIVSRSTQEFVTAQRELFRISQETRTALEGTVSLYTRVAGVAQRAGRSQVEVLKFTETVSKGLQVSGASAAEAQNTIIQLGQALASGALRGDEFNSLRENAGALVQVLADNIKGVDGNMGKLREFAEQGKLTFDVIFNAALGASAKINADYAQLPVTVGAAFTVLENAFMKFVGEVDKSTGITAALSSGLVSLSKNLDLVAASLAGLAAAGIVASLGTIIGLIRTATTATIAWTAALATNPIGLLAVAISSAVAALVYYRNELVNIGNQTVRVGNVISAVWTTIAAPIEAAVKWLAAMVRTLAALAAFDFSSVGRGLGDGAQAMKGAVSDIEKAWSRMNLRPGRDMGRDSVNNTPTPVAGVDPAEVNDKEQLVNAIERIIGAYDREKKIAFEVADARKHLNAAMEAGSQALKDQIAAAGGVDSILKRYEAQLRSNTTAVKQADAVTQAFKDQIDDVNRFLADQAGGLTEAEKAYQPYAAQIEKLNDLLAKKGVTDQQRIAIQETINKLELAGRVAMEDANAKLQRQIDLRTLELNRLKERNGLMSRVVAGGSDGLKAGVELEAKVTQWQIDDAIRGLTDSLRDARGQISETNQAIIDATEAEMKRNAVLERQAQINGLAQTAADSLGNIFTRIQSGDWGSVAEGVGKFVTDFQTLEKKTGSTAGAFKELGENLLKSAEAGNALGNMLGSLFGRSAAEQKNAQKGGAIGGTVGSFFGMKGAGAFVGNIIGGFFGTSKAMERAAQKAADVAKLNEQIDSFLQAASSATDMQKQLTALDAQFQSLRREAERLKQPVDLLTKAYEAQRKKILDAFGSGIDELIDKYSGRQAMADLRALLKVQEQRIKDALVAEYDLGKVRRANALELADFFSNLTEDQLAAFGDLVSALDRVKARIRDLTTTITDQLDKQIDTAKELASAARQQASAFRQLAVSLREQILANKTGDLSPLSPGDRFSALNTEFQRLFGLAMGGDQDAAGKLGDAGTSLLEAAKAMYATGPEYVAIFNQVQEALAKTAEVADVRATALERIADLADTQVVILEAIRDVLNTDLGQPTADAIAAAIADGVLTVGEIQGINTKLDELGLKFANVTGPAADAVKSAIETLRQQLAPGVLTDAQKAALTTGQQAIADALNGFKAQQIDEYRKALIAAGDAIGKMQNFLLDPNGKIPAAIEAAFKGADIQASLATGIETLFNDALGDAWEATPLVVRADQTLAQAVGQWTAENLSTRITSQFGEAIANWATGSDPRTLVQRVDEVFSQAIGDETGNWQGTLKSLLDQQSPLVLNLQALTAQIPLLIDALKNQAANDNASGAYDAAMQAFVNPIKNAAVGAVNSIASVPIDKPSGGKNNRTDLSVNIASGLQQNIGGNAQNEGSRQRAAELGSIMQTLGQQLEMLTGGTLGTIQVRAGEDTSGYRVGSIDRMDAYDGNAHAQIISGFINDAIKSLSGGNVEAIKILQGTDFTDITAGFTNAAAEIYKLLNPPAFAAGGMHAGGLRLVGENGPELEVTGPARYFSASQTASMIDGAYGAVAGRSRGQAVTDPALLSELRALRASNEAMAAELSAYRKEQAERDGRIIRSNEAMAADSKRQAGQAGERRR
jgi:tape measure domain-containing protein